MTSRKVQPTMIGIFVILSCLLFVIAVIIFGGSRFFDKENIVIAYFDGSLKGLSIGAPVTYRGVTVGKVKEIKIHIQEGDQDSHRVIIPVLIALSRGSSINVDDPNGEYDGSPDEFLKTMIAQGLRAKLKLQSLVTGQRYIDLAVYENSEAIYQDKAGRYLEIPTLPSEVLQVTRLLENMDFEELYSRVTNIFEALDSLTANLSTSLDGERMAQMLDELSAGLSSFNSIMTKVETGVSPAFESMNNSLGQMEELTSHAGKVFSSVDSRLPALMEEMTTTVSLFNETMLQAQLLLTQAGKSLRPTSPLYHQFTEAMRQLEKTASSVENLSELLYRNPNALILGVQPTGDSAHDR